jgi:hypothetical protein
LNLVGGPAAMNFYNWEGPNAFTSTAQNPTFGSANNLMSGTYTLTVTDGNGCSDTETTTVTVDFAPTVAAGDDAIVCEGGYYTLDGSFGGTASSITWSTSGDGSFNDPSNPMADYYPGPSDVVSGTITLTINTDDPVGGCTSVSDNVVLTVNSNPVVAGVETDETCEGNDDGMIDITVTDGTPTYSYTWSTGASTEDISSLPDGTYTVTVSDMSGCSAVDSYTINPGGIVTASISESNALCNGSANGSATVTASGGSGIYTYQWDAGAGNQTTQMATGLAAGTYNVTVTDDNGCTATDVATISEPTPLIPSMSSTVVDCYGDNSGTASVAASGGTPSYTYLWSDVGAQTTLTASGLAAGTYTVTVTDANGCIAQNSVVVNEPPAAMTATISASNNITCNGYNDGSATVSASAGTIPYTYLWNDLSAQTTTTATGLSAGTFTVTVTDNNGCTATTSVAITENTVVTANITASSDPTCNGGNDGDMTVTAGGGTGTYVYSWNNSGTTATVTGLTAGTYSVTVADGDGCTAYTSATLTDPTIISATPSVTDANCGNSDGEAYVTPIGGSGVYTYDWSPNGYTGDGTATYSDLPAGSYTVTVTDDQGCTEEFVANVNDAGAPTVTISASQDVTCNGDADGSASCFVSGGTPPYDYLWSSGSVIDNISGVSGGTYTISVTDDLGCMGTNSVIINEPDVLSLVESSTDVTCNGDMDGSATIVASGGNGAYTYVWSDPMAQTTDIATGLEGGTYTVTVLDAMSCQEIASVVVLENTAVTGSISSNNATGFGVCDGDATITPSGGTGVYSYIWDGGAVTATATSFCAGTFGVTVTDDSGCSYTDNVVITEPSELIASHVVDNNASCNGDCDGGATVSAIGGTIPYTYDWPTGAMTPSVTDLCAGTYEVTVIDDNGYTATTTVTITEPLLLELSLSSSADVLCNGNADGTGTVAASGGTPPYSYDWGEGTIVATANTLTAGSYTVTAIDAYGCLADLVVTINEPTLLEVSGIPSDATTIGGNDGAIDITVTGGTLNYVYLWNTAEITEDITGLTAGTYQVTVTDANGCEVVDSYTVNDPANSAPVANPDIVELMENGAGDVFDVAANDTDADMDPLAVSIISGPTNGTGMMNGNNIEYLPDLDFVGQDTIFYEISDGYGGTDNSYLAITVYEELLSNAGTTNASCYGGADGSAFASPTGGMPPYNYEWNTTELIDSIVGLSAGTYTVTVTDSYGNTVSQDVDVTEPSEIQISTDYTTSPCFGMCDGEIAVNVTGGTPGYDYNWSPSATNSATISSLCAGDYYVTVTDILGCTQSSIIPLTEYSEVIVNIGGDQIICEGDAITLDAGAGYTTYLWSESSTTQTIQVDQNGTFGVTVTDANGCEGNDEMMLTANIVTQDTLVVEICNGQSYFAEGADQFVAGFYHDTLLTTSGCDSIIVTDLIVNDVPVVDLGADVTLCIGESVSLDAGVYESYSWSSGETTQIIDAYMVGNQSVTVTDVNGCLGVDTIEITNFPEIVIDFTTADASCGNDNGNITANISGGSGAVSVLWSNSETSTSITGLAPGTYMVTATDNEGCTKESSAQILDAASPSVQLFSVHNASCNGLDDGYADIDIEGGVPPYTFLWSDGSTLEDIANVPAGSYSVTVTDNNSCTSGINIVIGQPTLLQVTEFTTEVSCFDGMDAAINLQVQGGISPYVFNWSNGSTTQDISGIIAGTYTVTVTDDNGCTQEGEYIINQPDELLSSVTADNIVCLGSTTQAEVVASGGTIPYSYYWSNSSYGAISSGLTGGQYYVTVVDANGCQKLDSVTITEPASELVLSISKTNVTCNGFADGTATVVAAGGVEPYSYLWNDVSSSTVEQIQDLTVGVYRVTVTDDYGCSKVVFTNVTEPPLLYSAAQSTDLTCFESNDGTAGIVATGGTPPYDYSWSNGATTDMLSALSAGDYTVTVTDAKGCQDVQSVILIEPAALELDVTGVDGTCTQNYGSAFAIGSGGTSPYIYQWSNGSSGQTQNYLNSGDYYVTVSDYYGCQKVDSVSIFAPELLSVSATATDASCDGEDGSISLAVTGGETPYSYQWSMGATDAELDDLGAGMYMVTVTDNSGCQDYTIVSVAASGAPIITPMVNDITCNGGANGQIAVSISGGSQPYEILWSTGETGQIISNLPSGPYEISVTDDEGCMITSSIYVHQPEPIEVAITSTSATCGMANGSLTANATGGTAPYQYFWSSGELGNVTNYLEAGAYNLTVSDSKGCYKYAMGAVSNYNAPVITASDVEPIACNETSGAIDVSVVGGVLPYEYQWSNGSNEQDLTALTYGDYQLTVTDASNCKAVLNVIIPPEPPVSNPICLVTVDDQTGNNVVVWEKEVTENVAAYNVYRESSMNGIYFKIGSQPFDDASVYMDTISDVDNWSWHYKLTTVDLCGNESLLSYEGNIVHHTIHLSVDLSDDETDATLSWNQYIGFTFEQYYIYRYITDEGLSLIDSVVGTQNTYIDADFPENTVYYIVEVKHPDACEIDLGDKASGNYNSSRSNIASKFNGDSDEYYYISEVSNNMEWLIFPNPNDGRFSMVVNANASEDYTVTVFTVDGRAIMEEDINLVNGTMYKEFDLSSNPPGFYHVRLQSKSGTFNKKIVIEN